MTSLRLWSMFCWMELIHWNQNFPICYSVRPCRPCQDSRSLSPFNRVIQTQHESITAESVWLLQILSIYQYSRRWTNIHCIPLWYPSSSFPEGCLYFHRHKLHGNYHSFKGPEPWVARSVGWRTDGSLFLWVAWVRQQLERKWEREISHTNTRWNTELKRFDYYTVLNIE